MCTLKLKKSKLMYHKEVSLDPTTDTLSHTHSIQVIFQLTMEEKYYRLLMTLLYTSYHSDQAVAMPFLQENVRKIEKQLDEKRIKANTSKYIYFAFTLYKKDSSDIRLNNIVIRQARQKFEVSLENKLTVYKIIIKPILNLWVITIGTAVMNYIIKLK